MTRTILVAGTASHVGKSTVAAGLCRWLADRGVDVAPFKAQNMSNNARAVPRATGEGFGEVGVSQYVQARAARVAPSTDHNPVLLKPRGSGESQLILDGEAVGHYAAGTYYDDYWERARATAERAHARLADQHEVVVAEGAGSIAEINLYDRDLANLETARFADADIVLVADIERGGVFAAIEGTVSLLPADVRERLAGVLITKFRGDRSLLEPGIADIEDRTGVPVLGVLPHDDPGLPEEDSLALPGPKERATWGADDGVADERAVTVAVPRLPRISNATDLEPLARDRGVRVQFRPIDAPVGDADAVVLPGTKNTVDDLRALREAGLHERLREYDGVVVGLCGGYQLLGERIENIALEGTKNFEIATIDGVGLLPVRTRFSPEKTVEHVTRNLRSVGPLSGAGGTVEGYEIHAGQSRLVGEAARPFAGAGAATERVLGTYLHDLFGNEIVRDAFVRNLFERANLDRPERALDGDGAVDGAGGHDGADPYDRAAALLSHANLDALKLP